MHNLYLIISGVTLLGFALLMAPRVLAMNRGKLLQNITVWLAVFVTLGLIYKYFGPESANPLFSYPAATYGLNAQQKLEIQNKEDHPAKEQDNDKLLGVPSLDQVSPPAK